MVQYKELEHYGKTYFLIVLDSFGIGAEPDAPAFGDAGTNTLGAIAGHPNFKWDQLARLACLIWTV